MAHIRRITLVDQVIDELGRLIRESWTGGEELPSIAELGEQFGVSRAVVREALKALEAQGMVEIMNGKRARVATESTRPLLRLFANALGLDAVSNGEIAQLWRALEGDAAALAATHRTERELDALLDLARRFATQTDNPSGLEELDEKLHEGILRAAHNGVLRDLVLSLREVLVEPVAGESATARIRAEDVRLNARLVSAISRRDPHAARRAMELRFLTVHQRASASAPEAIREPRSVPST